MHGRNAEKGDHDCSTDGVRATKRQEEREEWAEKKKYKAQSYTVL